LRYDPGVAAFGSVPVWPTSQDWRDAARLLGAGEAIALVRPEPVVPEGWELMRRMDALQMVATTALAAPDPQTERLSATDVPEMLDLVARTRPGPFFERTIELGTYLGLREDGKLIAMAGERLSSEGFTEISAICTDPEYRGRGLATRMIGAVAAGVESRGDRAYLHVRADNLGAIRVYERAGFVVRAELVISVIAQPPADD
jgi:predicted GNAT family acetyltransferase